MIIICIPYYDKIDSRTIESVNNTNLLVRTMRSTYLANSRNLMTHNNTSSRKWQTLSKEITHYLYVDSGNVFDPINVDMLLKHDLPIISGAYKARNNDEFYCAGHAEYKPNKITKNYLPITTKGLREVDIVGAGFLLVKREVLEKMDYPWFRYEWIRFKKNDIEYQTQSGEDVGFCIHAKRYGYKIYVDCDCIIKHYH